MAFWDAARRWLGLTLTGIDPIALDALRQTLAGLDLELANTLGLSANNRPPIALPATSTPADKPLNSGIDGYGGFGDWNPWSRYENPIAAFFDYYQQIIWVRMVCDKISRRVLSYGWQLIDQTTATSTHPMYAPLMSWLTAINYDNWRFLAALDLTICENAFSYIQRNGLGQVTNLLRIAPATMKPVGDAWTGIQYWRQTVGQDFRIFQPDQILHLKGPNPVTDLVGLPKLTSAAIDMEADEAMANFNRSYFGNGTQAGSIMTWDQSDLRNPKTGEWTDQDERKAQNVWAQMASYIERRFQNPISAHLPLLLRGKWQVHGNGQAKADAQFLEGRKFNAQMVCALYGFPIEALGLGQRGALGGNLTDSAEDQLDDCVSSYEGLIDSQFAGLFLQQHLGIAGLITAAKPRTRKITLDATSAALNLAKAASFSRNEIRGVVYFPRLATGGDDIVQVTPTGTQKQPDVELPEAPIA
jgi:hypothetical protein